MIWLLGVAVLALGLMLVERLLVSPEDQLTAEDVLALPHSRIRLVARVERFIFRFVDPALRGVEIEFFEGAVRLGSATTDAKGFASIEIDAGPVGRRRLRVATRRAEESLAVDVRPPETQVLVLDLDHTVADVGTLRFAMATNKDVRPLPGAADVIRRLANRFAIVYLSARDHSFLAKTREWLRLQDLPDGPIYLRRRRFWSQRPSEHKIERLAEMKRTHRVAAGVGDLPGDAKAYLSQGLATFLMDPRGALPDIDGAVRVKSWEELESKIAASDWARSNP